MRETIYMWTDCLDRTSRTNEHSNYGKNAQNTTETLHSSKCYNHNMKEQYLINANKSYVCNNYDTVIGLWKKFNKSGFEQKFQQNGVPKDLINSNMVNMKYNIIPHH